MLAALGSPIRSSAPPLRQGRTPPSSPRPPRLLTTSSNNAFGHLSPTSPVGATASALNAGPLPLFPLPQQQHFEQPHPLSPSAAINIPQPPILRLPPFIENAAELIQLPQPTNPAPLPFDDDPMLIEEEPRQEAPAIDVAAAMDVAGLGAGPIAAAVGGPGVDPFWGLLHDLPLGPVAAPQPNLPALMLHEDDLPQLMFVDIVPPVLAHQQQPAAPAAPVQAVVVAAAPPIAAAAAPGAVNEPVQAAEAGVARTSTPLAKGQPRNPEVDLEPGIWILPNPGGETEARAGSENATAAEQKLSDPIKVFLRSLNSNTRTRVMFSNQSPHDVTALWLDYNGQEVPYGGIKPGQTKIYDTYASHPWIFRCSATGDRMLVGGRATHYSSPPPPPPRDEGLLSLGQRNRRANRREQRVDITVTPMLAHTRATHSAFPSNYKAASRALLLAHQRRQRPELEVAAGAAAIARRTVGDVMCRMFRNAITSVVSAAQPAMQAMGVCAPAPHTDICARAVSRWLDGTRLLDDVSGSRPDEEMSDVGADIAAAGHYASPVRVRAVSAPCTPVVGFEMASVAGELRAPNLLHMRDCATPPEERSPAKGSPGCCAPQGQGQQSARRRLCRGGRWQAAKRDVSRVREREAAADAEAAKLGELLAGIPVDLVRHIVHFMAPVVRQDVSLYPVGCPDIMPAMLPSDPSTWATSSAAPANNA